MATCNKCGNSALAWAKGKSGKWYLSVEKTWRGDMGGIRVFHPAHKCSDVIDNSLAMDADEKQSKLIDAGYPGIV